MTAPRNAAGFLALRWRRGVSSPLARMALDLGAIIGLTLLMLKFAGLS